MTIHELEEHRVVVDDCDPGMHEARRILVTGSRQAKK